ncbi:MAG TPA: hypothetical protein VGA93_04960 [Actinomycetota bacterium]
MMTATSNRLIRDYLDDFRSLTRDLPKRRRDELLGEIEAHIAEALSPQPSEAEIRAVLDRLGDPEQIAAEERERLGIVPKRAGALEWIAVVLLLIGGIVVPVIGWIVGVVLLWASSVWTVRDKLIGTLVVPGGLLPALYFTVAPVWVTREVCRGVPVQAGPGHVGPGGAIVCTASPTATGRVLGIAILVVLAVAPVLTAIYLARRAKRATVAGA